MIGYLHFMICVMNTEFGLAFKEVTMYKVNDLELEYRIENNDGSWGDCDAIMYALKLCYEEVEQHIDNKTWQDIFEWEYHKLIDNMVSFRSYNKMDGEYPMEVIRYMTETFYELCDNNKILVVSKLKNYKERLKLTKVNEDNKTKLHIYKVVRHEPIGYDTYDSCVVCAESGKAAMNILPWGRTIQEEFDKDMIAFAWTERKENISCEYIGEATGRSMPGVILASYNAG